MLLLFRPFRIFFLAILVILSMACCNKTAPKKTEKTSKSEQFVIASIVSPEQEKVFILVDSIRIDLDLSILQSAIDSILILSNDNSLKTKLTENYDIIYWQTTGCRVGRNTARIKIHYNDSLVESHVLHVVLLSDIIPENYQYTVIHTYPHDPEAYTQGLLYHNELLYESTGLEGKSTLRINNITTGKSEKMISLSPELFAEGISVFNDQIYQITWRSKIGFIYDINTLELIRRFDYQIDEGWGLTSDSKNLIMSDGSEHLYILEPDFFTQIGQIEVFDNKGMVSSLNELEFINGKVLANVYGESYIVIIDMKTGKVVGKLDMDKLMPEGTKGDMGKVLNGIAYNPLNQHFYITGKHWPVLYEITITPSL